LSQGGNQQAQRHIRHVIGQHAGCGGDIDTVLCGIRQVDGICADTADGDNFKRRQAFHYLRESPFAPPVTTPSISGPISASILRLARLVKTMHFVIAP
jgi:hypothetical protein